MESDPIVRDYLARLDDAAERLPAGRRGELVAEVREHIESALAAQATTDEATVRNILDRLGTPDEIVAAEIDTVDGAAPASGGPGAADRERSGIGLVEVLALLLVTVGAFLVPILGPVAGMMLVWLSRVWSTRQKLVVSGIAVAIVVLPIVGLLSVGAQGDVMEGSLIPAP